jgi:hypothetical protein
LENSNEIKYYYICTNGAGNHKNRVEPEKPMSRDKLIFFVMLKKIKILVVLFLTIFALSSCSITLPVTATSNPIGEKVGTATAVGFLGVFFFDADASIRTAAKNGGITKISTVDIKSSNYFGLIVSYETIVTGK